MARILETLERHSLFNGTPREDLADLLVDCRLRTPFRGDRLFSAGEEGAAFFLVVSGRVKLSTTSPTGRECLVEIAEAGDTFALVPVLDGDVYPVTATALTDAAVIRIPRGAFLRLLARRPEIGPRATREIAHRMRRFRARLEEISTHTVAARMATHLLRTAREQCGEARAGATLDLGATREVVAAALGTVREVFVRTLHGFERGGMITIDARRVTLVDPERLRGIAEDRARRTAGGGQLLRAALREGSLALRGVEDSLGVA